MLQPDYIDKGDLVSILLQDENFKDNRSRIIDEAMTFFLAGSVTTSTMVTNSLLCSLMKPEIFDKMRNEVKETIIKPSKGDQQLKFGEIIDITNIENSSELRYMQNCFSESLRIDTPVATTSTLMFTEDV